VPEGQDSLISELSLDMSPKIKEVDLKEKI
jgi:hypothetical protein